ncbi:hypothetical protein RSK20926_14629 [Roseobacter sp. SK209-2-6]|uniref:pentapeptide repeat-containing protein n=1 Tax=Roseobacter sp. SK209-2-6 TaxID=388739 RepID=UPI0000F3D503|nr:pentapeptide repeat-containing protein [Roseobacter sp. SK209-2-6]EBA15875.1 hypothetical protein RSK20926_14629 [Roseobacter sp. SK209-2-6]
MRDETEAPAPATPQRKLTPANENPWYVLMTLYGEQEGEQVDWKLHEKNRKAWNAWAGQGLSEEARTAAIEKLKFEGSELEAWPAMASKIKIRFKKEFLRRNPGVISAPELPNCSERINVSNTYFANTLVLTQAIFVSLGDYRGSSFKRGVYCNNVFFTRGVYFCSSHFVGVAKFSNTVFSHLANFRSARFLREVDFTLSDFLQVAIFCDSQFLGVSDFKSVSFRQNASFSSARFEGECRFVSSKFGRVVSFYRSQFGEIANFRLSSYAHDADFSLSSFAQAASFRFASFKRGVDFRAATFGASAYFVKVVFGAGASRQVFSRFDDCLFHGPTSFRRAQFRKRYPTFAGAVMHDNTVFPARFFPREEEIKLDAKLLSVAYWPVNPDQDPAEARESCATIRHILAQKGLPEDEHFFFRREMYFAGKIGSIWQRLPYLLFGLFSEYGYSILRPVLWLLAFWALGFAAFCGYFYSCCVLTPDSGMDNPVGSAMALSFSNLFPLFGFRSTFLFDLLTKLPTVLKVLSGFQTVASLPLLFFLGLGLRQRFRLR